VIFYPPKKQTDAILATIILQYAYADQGQNASDKMPQRLNVTIITASQVGPNER